MLDALDDATATTEDTVPGRRLTGRQLGLLGVGVATIRFTFASDRRVFHVLPDEPASLAMARFLSGGGRWNMFINATWRPGLATVITPLFWLTDDQVTIIRLTMLLGAVLGGIGAILMARLAMRLTDLSPSTALASSAIIALTPASLIASAHVWAEPLVTLTFLLVLGRLLSFVDRPRLGAALGAVGWSVVAYTCHGRMLPLVGTALAVTLGMLIVGRQWRNAGAVALFGVALVAASSIFASWLYESLWVDPGEFNTIGGVAGRLGDPIAILDAATGQVWYLLATTLGLFGIGSAVIGLRATRRPAGGPGLSTIDAGVLIAVTAPLMGLSALFMSDRPRPDQLVYGRYNEAIVWPVLIVAAAWIMSVPWRSIRTVARPGGRIGVAVVVVWIGSGLVTWTAHRDDLIGLDSTWPMVSGVLALNGSTVEIRVLSLTAGTLALATALCVLACWRPRVATAALAICVAVAGLRTHQFLSPGLNQLEVASVVQEIGADALPPDAPVTFAYVNDKFEPRPPYTTQRLYAHAYQWYLPDHEFTITFDGSFPPGAYVFAPSNAPGLASGDATALWVDPVVGITLWRVAPRD